MSERASNRVPGLMTAIAGSQLCCSSSVRVDRPDERVGRAESPLVVKVTSTILSADTVEGADVTVTMSEWRDPRELNDSTPSDAARVLQHLTFHRRDGRSATPSRSSRSTRGAPPRWRRMSPRTPTSSRSTSNSPSRYPSSVLSGACSWPAGCRSRRGRGGRLETEAVGYRASERSFSICQADASEPKTVISPSAVVVTALGDALRGTRWSLHGLITG